VKAKSSQDRSGLKARLASALRGGTGSLVLAATVLSSRPAQAATEPSDASLADRAKGIRSDLLAANPEAARASSDGDRLAWWGNWHNWGGWHPYWHNWPNWHNWHNWRNW
jgi:hypothetical protein